MIGTEIINEQSRGNINNIRRKKSLNNWKGQRENMQRDWSDTKRAWSEVKKCQAIEIVELIEGMGRSDWECNGSDCCRCLS